MSYIWRDSYNVRASEVDFKGRIKPNAIFELMQEAAEHSASSLGFGYEYVKKNNIFWVLSRVNLVIYELPVQGDKITVDTWPKGANRVFAMRDFNMYNKGALCLAATTAWLLLDSKTKSIIRYQDFPGTGEIDAIKEQPPKLKTNLEFYNSYAKKIRISELDVNNHVNNSRYIAWAVDAIDYNKYCSSPIQEIAINYISEIKYGDEVTIRKTNFIDKGKEIFVDAVNKETEKPVIMARIRFTD